MTRGSGWWGASDHEATGYSQSRCALIGAVAVDVAGPLSAAASSTINPRLQQLSEALLSLPD